MVTSEPLIFALQVLRGRWFMFFACLLIMSSAGATYLFAAYSKDIKSTLGYNQEQLNTIAFFKDNGSNVGILAGLIGEIAPPSVLLSIGAAMNLVGYLMIYLSITGRVARPKFWQMCLYMLIGTNSQTFANTGAVVTAVKSFPESRGTVIGLMKGFLGLSGAITTQLYFAIYGNDSKFLVLFIAWLPAVVSCVFVHTIRIIRAVNQTDEFRVFCSFLYMSLGLAGFIMVVTIVQKRVVFSHSEYGASAAIVIVLLLLPVLLVFREEFKLFQLKKKQSFSENQECVISVQVDHENLDANGNTTHEVQRVESAVTSSNSGTTSTDRKSCSIWGVIKACKPPKKGEDYSIIQALLSIEMIILLLATVSGIGGTLAAIDNMGQIGESLGYSPMSISTFVSLISIWNFLGRAGVGFLSEILLSKYKFPRPLLFAMVMVLACSGHLLIALGVHGSLYVASVIIGFCFGAQMPLLFSIISELFGLKYFSTLLNIAGCASPVASYALNVRIVGYLYDKEAAKQNESKIFVSAEKASTCIGVQCFKLSFLIITALTMLGAVVMLLLVWRTREFYSGDIYAKFKDHPSGVEEDNEGKEKKEEAVNTDG